MKKVTTILAAILLMAVGAAAQKLSYQAVVRNSSNELVPNTALTVEVSILDAVGVVQYAETHSATTNQNGLLVLTIGDGTVTAGTTVADVNWNGAAIQSVVKNGSIVVATITSPVNAVPYALQAGSSAQVNDGTLTIILPDGTSKTFTANQGGDTEVTIPAPTTMTADDLIVLVNGMTDEQKAALKDALFVCGTSKMVDANGNEYETVQIGTQCWTKTNLRSTKAADGSDIPAGGSATSSTDPYYYDCSSHTLPLATRGYLYNWPAAMEVCPAGWHLPSDAEWNTMEATVSGSDWQTSYETSRGWRGDHASSLAGGGWKPSTTAGAPGNASDPAHNTSGFSVVPTGGCWGSLFYDWNSVTDLWSATLYESNPTENAIVRGLYYNKAEVGNFDGPKYYGFSVRCLRD